MSATWATFVVILIGAVGLAWLTWRGGGGTALRSLRDANEVLERRVREQDKMIVGLQRQVASLQARTDISLAITPIADWTTAHEVRAQQRHDATLKVLEMIADRLGPEPEHERTP